MSLLGVNEIAIAPQFGKWLKHLSLLQTHAPQNRMSNTFPLKATIVIVTHNRSALVLDSIQSAAFQTNSNVEIIVVDDGSSDDTGRVLRNSDLGVKYVLKEHSGLAASRNVGLGMARGEVIIFLDDDDLITPDKVSIQSRILSEKISSSAVYSRWQISTLNQIIVKVDGADQTSSLLQKLICTNIAPIHAFMFRKDHVMNLGGFDESLKTCEDWDLLLRLVLSGGCLEFTPEITAIYRINPNGMSANPKPMLEGALRVVDKTFANPLLPAQFKPYFKTIVKLQYLILARYRFSMADYSGATYCLRTMASSYPDTAIWLFELASTDIANTSLDEYKIAADSFPIQKLSQLIDGEINKIPSL